MRYVIAVIIGSFMLLLAGCAMYPTTTPPTDIPPRTLLSWIVVRGQINPAYYYFLALDTDGDPATGPVPIVTGPELGNGWGTISGLGPNDPVRQPPFFVMYHNGTFMQYRNGVPVGTPYRAEVSSDASSNRNRITVEVDLRDIVASGESIPSVVELNWITDNTITPDPSSGTFIDKQYDGFGPLGNDYLDSVQLNTTNSWTSGDNGIAPELPDEGTTDLADIDIVGWHVEVKIRENTP